MSKTEKIPHNPDAERNVISGCFFEPRMYTQLSAYLKPRDFFGAAARTIWKHFEQMDAEKIDFNPVTLWDRIERAGDIESFAGERARIGEFIESASIFGRFSAVRSQVEIILRTSLEREMLNQARYIQNRVMDGEGEPYALIEEILRRLKSLTGRRLSGDWKGADESFQEALEELVKFSQGNIGRVVPTGFYGLDRLLLNGGFAPGHFCVVAARTSRGKSTFALQACINALRSDPDRVIAFFTIEQSPAELMKRVIAMETRAKWEYFAKAQFTAEEKDLIADLRRESKTWKFPIIHRGKMTPGMVHADAQRIQQEYGRLDMIVVDHLGLIRPQRQFDQRSRELGEISHEMKSIAVDLDTVALVPVQVNREGDKNDRILLRHLRDSGEIEQDADAVMIINVIDERGEEDDIAFDLQKQRNGRQGCAEVLYNRNCGRFEDLKRDPVTASEIEWSGSRRKVSRWQHTR